MWDSEQDQLNAVANELGLGASLQYGLYVEADVLAVLARAHTPLTGLRVHELAGRSYSRVRLVLGRLVDHGLVSVEQHGNTFSYVLNRDHALAGPVEAMVMANRAIEDELRDSAAQFAVGAVAVVLFGSFARRDGDADSDIDILTIRSDEMDADDEAWVDGRRHEPDGAMRGQRCAIIARSPFAAGSTRRIFPGSRKAVTCVVHSLRRKWNRTK